MREVSEIEARLKRHRDDNRYIDNQIERLETLILRMKGVSSPSLSGMPHNPSSDVDKIGQMLERKEKLEADIRELIADRDRERDELRSIIGCIHKPDQRSVLEMRYLDGAEWREIAEMLFSFKPDFDDSDEKYLRRTFKLHREAIDTLNARLSQQRPNPATEMQEILLPKWGKVPAVNGMEVKETKRNSTSKPHTATMSWESILTSSASLSAVMPRLTDSTTSSGTSGGLSRSDLLAAAASR